MRTERYSIVMDSYAWIEYFAGTAIGEIVRKYMMNSENVYTPSIVLAEIARKYVREGVGWSIVEERIRVIEKLSIIIHINSRIALETARAYIELVNHAKELGYRSKPSLTDAIVYAVAKIMNAMIISGDMHFRDLDNVLWLKTR